MLLNPRDFMVDESVKPFIKDQRVDLLAADTKKQAAGRYFVFEHKVTKGNVLVIKGLVPYACERTDVGTTDEAFAMIDPLFGNGCFSFEPQVNGNAPFTVSLDYNAPRISTGTLLNADRARKNGFSHISKAPLDDAKQAYFNPIFSFLVPSDNTLSVVFSILSVGSSSPMPNPYTIGGTSEKRVDFAGVVVVGVEMSEQLYRKTAADLQKKV